MSRTKTVSDSVVVVADPTSLYAAVSDPTRMGEWSPENRGATVTAADPGTRFAFRVDKIGVKTPRVTGRNASWEYRFDKVEGGTRVTETWTDDRQWPDLVATVFDKIVTRGSHFADFQRRNIAKTLSNLKAAYPA